MYTNFHNWTQSFSFAFSSSPQPGVPWIDEVKGRRALQHELLIYTYAHRYIMILGFFFVSLYFSEFIAKTHIFRDLLPYRPFQELIHILHMTIYNLKS